MSAERAVEITRARYLVNNGDGEGKPNTPLEAWGYSFQATTREVAKVTRDVRRWCGQIKRRGGRHRILVIQIGPGMFNTCTALIAATAACIADEVIISNNPGWVQIITSNGVPPKELALTEVRRA